MARAGRKIRPHLGVRGIVNGTIPSILFLTTVPCEKALGRRLRRESMFFGWLVDMTSTMDAV